MNIFDLATLRTGGDVMAMVVSSRRWTCPGYQRTA